MSIIRTPDDFAVAGRELYERWQEKMSMFNCSTDNYDLLELENRDAWSMLAQDVLNDIEGV